MEVCRNEKPPLVSLADGHETACWLHDGARMAALGKTPGLPPEAQERIS